MAWQIRIGEAEILARPGEPVRITVADTDAPTREETAPEWIKFCDSAGPDVAHLFFGSGWQKADRRCREGFHREVPLIQASKVPSVLCRGDLKVIRKAREAREAASADSLMPIDATLDRLRWLEVSIEAAIETCEAPIFVLL